jgi:hypothetical protein
MLKCRIILHQNLWPLQPGFVIKLSASPTEEELKAFVASVRQNCAPPHDQEAELVLWHVNRTNKTLLAPEHPTEIEKWGKIISKDLWVFDLDDVAENAVLKESMRFIVTSRKDKTVAAHSLQLAVEKTLQQPMPVGTSFNTAIGQDGAGFPFPFSGGLGDVLQITPPTSFNPIHATFATWTRADFHYYKLTVTDEASLAEYKKNNTADARFKAGRRSGVAVLIEETVAAYDLFQEKETHHNSGRKTVHKMHGFLSNAVKEYPTFIADCVASKLNLKSACEEASRLLGYEKDAEHARKISSGKASVKQEKLAGTVTEGKRKKLKITPPADFVEVIVDGAPSSGGEQQQEDVTPADFLEVNADGAPSSGGEQQQENVTPGTDAVLSLDLGDYVRRERWSDAYLYFTGALQRNAGIWQQDVFCLEDMSVFASTAGQSAAVEWISPLCNLGSDPALVMDSGVSVCQLFSELFYHHSGNKQAILDHASRLQTVPWWKKALETKLPNANYGLKGNPWPRTKAKLVDLFLGTWLACDECSAWVMRTNDVMYASIAGKFFCCFLSFTI